MSITYPEYTHSSFPDQLDKQINFTDPSARDMDLIRQYDQYLSVGNNFAALNMLEENPHLLDCQINADKLKRIHHSILALQHFFFDDVREKIYKIGQLKGDWTATMCTNAMNEDGTEDTENALHMYDIVRYPVRYYNISREIGIMMSEMVVVDELPTVGEGDTIYILEFNPAKDPEKYYLRKSIGIYHECYIFTKGKWKSVGQVEDVNQYFMVISNDIQAGDIPIENLDKYMQMSIKGDRGEAGYTPVKNVDYFDGQSGTGMSPRGAWDSNAIYTANDLVSHNGYLWYTPNGCRGSEPSVDSEDWIKLDVSLQLAVGTETPAFLEEGGLWLHVQNDGHVILKTKVGSGYMSYMPETEANYVFDNTGTSLQKKIYQHYFERDDVEVTIKDNDPVYTMEARLIDTDENDVIVARVVLTENADGTETEVFTTFDEYGENPTYQCTRVYKQVGNVYYITPSVSTDKYSEATYMRWIYI